MITLGSVYLIAKDFDQSIEFYRKLLERNVSAQNMSRFAVFNIDSLCLCIMNGYFDVQNPDKVVKKGEQRSEYDDMARIAEAANPGKIVINLATDNLKAEYDRLHSLGIGKNLTAIRYINAKSPYYYFSLKDPDDNIIEITGEYEE